MLISRSRRSKRQTFYILHTTGQASPCENLQEQKSLAAKDHSYFGQRLLTLGLRSNEVEGA